MSFYWQSAVSQEPGQPAASTWDNINLGGSPPQPQQPAQQTFSYENQQSGGYEQYVNPYADQWAAYHAQQAALQEQQQAQAAAQQVTHQPQIEHQPILAQPPQPAVESHSAVSVATTDQTTQQSQSNHTAYDGWGHGEWSSHEPSVEPQVQPPVDAHQYYNQQQQYYQEQIPQQPATIEQNWAPSEASVTTANPIESAPPSIEIPPPMEVPFHAEPVVKQETPQPSPHTIQYPTLPVAPSAVLDMGVDDEVEKKEERKEEEVEIKQEPQEEMAEESAQGWGEDWDEEGKEEGREVIDSLLDVPSTEQPRTSTPSPVEEQHEPEPTVSPIEAVKQEKESAPPLSPSPQPLVMAAFPSPPTILAPSEIHPPPAAIDTKSPGEEGLLQTDTTQKTSPPASTDSWVEVSSSGSDAIRERGGMGKDGVPPIASSSPARPEKRSSVSSVIGVVENGMERIREDSDSTHDSKRNVRDKFRDVKTQYSTIFKRLDGHRSSAREGNKTPTRVNPLLAAASNGSVKVRPVVGTKSSSTPKEYHQDSTYPPPLLNDISAIEPRMYGHHMDHSAVNMSMESRGYGEELVDAYRKDRHRAVRTSRPASRAKSEYGDPLLHPDRGERLHHSHLMHHPNSQYGYYPSGRYSLGRHSSMGMPYGVDPFENQRRSQSTYDHAAHLRMAQSGRGADYDAYEYVSSREESEEEEELPNESDNEMRRISHNAAAAAAAQSRSSMGVGMRRGVMPVGGGRAMPPMERLGEDEIFYLGCVNMEMRTAKRLLVDFPPHMDFWTELDAIERVAYLYYTYLHRKNFSVVSVFKDRFMERFLPLKRQGYLPQQGLAKIGKEMRDHYNAKVSINQRAYEASQRQLFSDEYDRGTPESRFSDRPSVYDHNQASDVDDVSEYTPREPLKFRLPHAFATFGPGGKIIQVQPSKSIGTVHMTDIHCIVKDREMQRNVALANNFKGPLFPNQTPPHVVRAYITRQMDRIKRSDLAQTDPRNDDIIDCLLIWQLLEKVVQQHGKVTGPDMAELLIRASHHRREKGIVGGSASLEIAPPTPDPKAYENFSLYLLQGLVDDAINFAMGEGLFSDALALARRLVPHRVDEIEKRQFTTRPPSHPVLTLMAVACEEAAPCLSSMASEDRGGWRCHAAILFANLSNSPFAMETIRRLGEELARRECNAAADFCFLSVALLGGLDTFTPYTQDPLTGLPPSVRRHIELIHASIPDDVAESTMCEYGFSLTDLHATEIFDYGSRLSGGATNLAISGPYQRRRIQYAKLLASWGGFTLDSFRYCTEVARTMWEKMSVFTARELAELTELAERLHKMAAADEASTLWIESLNQIIPSLRTAIAAPAFHSEPSAPAPAAASAAAPTAAPQQYVQPVSSEERTMKEEERTARARSSDSFSTEAAAWHSRMGDQPLEMRGEKREDERAEERRDADSAMYAAYHQQQQQQQPQYTADPTPSESRHSDFHQQYQSQHHHHHHQQNGQESSVHESAAQSQSHSATSQYDGYSSGTTTERGGYSEESSPERGGARERSASIHSHHSGHLNPLAPPSHHQHQQSHHQQPTPAPAAPPAAAPLRAPAPMPPMPSLSMLPPAAAPLQPMQQQPQLIKQETANSAQQQQQQPQKAAGSGGGLFSSLSNKFKSSVITTLSKATGNKEMILPDDSKPSIVYNPVTGRYEGEGVEEEAAPPPPPSIPGSMNGLSGMDAAGGGGGPPPMMMGGGLKAARNSGGSRYFNPLNDASNKTASSSGGPPGGGAMPPMGMPAPPTFPTQFSFIPTMPDDAVTDSPFSERPVLPEGAEGHQQEGHQ